MTAPLPDPTDRLAVWRAGQPWTFLGSAAPAVAAGGVALTVTRDQLTTPVLVMALALLALGGLLQWWGWRKRREYVRARGAAR